MDSLVYVCVCALCICVSVCMCKAKHLLCVNYIFLVSDINRRGNDQA